MFKKTCWVFLLCFCISTLLAQRISTRTFPWKKPPLQHLQGTSKLPQINISRQLEKRVAQTYKKAKQVQEQLPSNRYVIMGEPIKKITKTEELEPTELYPGNEFLKNSAQTGAYLVTRNNRLFIQEMQRMKKIWAQIDENLPRLQEEALATKQPQNPINWLAEIIPPQTTQLFIGEAHGYSEIHESVAQLMKNLRRQSADREIILFTEFLPENFTWSTHSKTTRIPEIFHKYFPIWEQALQENIKVVGLELPAAVDDECTVHCFDRKGVVMKQTVWATLEGVRLRNEWWQKTLAQYRAQHPQALFVVYAGADHVMYNRPFTLANNPQERPFVAILYPNKYRFYEATGRFTGTLIAKPTKGPLERIADLDLQQDIVRWQSPDLPAIAGFDVRIKVPVTLEDVDY